MSKHEAESHEADPAEGEDGEEGEPKKKGLLASLPLPVLIGAGAGIFLLINAGIAAGLVIMLAPKPAPVAEGEEAAAHGEKKKDEKKKEEKKEEGGHGEKKEGKGKEAGPVFISKEGPNHITYLTLPDMVVNIQAQGGKTSYLKLKMTVEVSNEDVVEQIKTNYPRLQDMFQSFLRELHPEDVAGSQGNYQLRQEMMRRINLVIAPAKVDSVLIEEMLIT